MSLLTAADVRRKVETALDDQDIQAIIDEEEAEVTRLFGPPGDGATPISETVAGGGASLFLSRPIVSVVSVAERAAMESGGVTLDAAAYHVWANQGRIARLPSGRAWGALATVTYIPADDRARRKQVLVELVRIAIQQTAMKSESVAGEYSYQAPDWDEARRALYRRLRFTEV